MERESFAKNSKQSLDLIRRYASTRDVSDCEDWAAWYRDEFGAEPDYSVILDNLTNSPEERRSILHPYIEPTPEDIEENRKTPTAAHKAIASLVSGGHIRVIITTNFDRLLEKALQDKGIEATVISTVDALLGAESHIHSKCYILKIHGDYKDKRILNTKSELENYHSEHNRLLDQLLDHYGLIVCGWSGEWDDALRSAILRNPSRRYPMYWAARGDLGEKAQQIASHRKAVSVPIKNADDFFERIRANVDVLDHNRNENPSSVQFKVDCAKRWLTRPECRIQLNDLFAQEVESASAKLTAQDFHDGISFRESISFEQDDGRNARASTNHESITKLADRYDGITEALIKMMGTLGRWGQGDELALAIDVIAVMGKQKIYTAGSNNILGSMKSYPAEMLFTAYGVGLTYARRWGDLLKFMTSKIAYSNRDQLGSLHGMLFGTHWEVTQQTSINAQSGVLKICFRVAERIDQFCRDCFGVHKEFDHQHGLFEMMGMMAEFNGFPSDDLKNLNYDGAYDSRSHRPGLPSVFLRTHNGKYWSDTVLDELADANTSVQILRAGFLDGDREKYEAFIKEFKFRTNRLQRNSHY